MEEEEVQLVQVGGMGDGEEGVQLMQVWVQLMQVGGMGDGGGGSAANAGMGAANAGRRDGRWRRRECG